ncbi:MAG: RNB domain-containing ribonuclease [Pseudomonadota bacterium]|nr:RNB domain-containing ribonuclease [Pseudomonadota bacterium]
MNALFEDGGKFHAGRIMSETESSLQIELASGKRVKVKAVNVLLRFAQPEPDALLAAAGVIAAELDLDLAWEFAPEGEFGFAALARDYFGESTDTAEQAAALLGLFGAPHYFRRLGKGNFKKAPEETVKAALLGIERKKQVAAQVDAWAAELAASVCPAAVREQLYKILFKPDKNAPEYKAVVDATRRTGRAPLDLLKAAGAIDSPYQFHWRRFLFEHFPKGTGFAAVEVPAVRDELPLAEAAAFSIDDSQTTEIDDALSVRGLSSGKVIVGIHIAAPTLAIAVGSPVDKIARDRLSTVYIPGHKLTMLPGPMVDAFTLKEGRESPVVSLYVTLDETTLATISSETRIERIAIAANLRHDRLDADVNAATLAAGLPPTVPFAAELSFLHRFAGHLKAAREKVRGKPETFNRPDYAFRIASEDGAAIVGDELVEIQARQRGSPLDLIVAESMILANSTWGGWRAECGGPAIYRSQASLAPGIKVRMGTRPGPHAGMGVSQYAWSTSPLRRYVDLVNQWQLVACARHGRTAALAAPFKPKDVSLLAIIGDFENAYGEYNGFQSAIERYWALQSLRQNDTTELDAAVMKDGLVRAEHLPLVFRAVGAESLPRGARVRVRVGAVDLLTLDLSASVLARLDAQASPASLPESTELGDDEEAAGPLAIAVDVAEGDAGSDAPPLAEPSIA